MISTHSRLYQNKQVINEDTISYTSDIYPLHIEDRDEMLAEAYPECHPKRNEKMTVPECPAITVGVDKMYYEI